MSAKFGPAGSSDSFEKMGYKGSLDVPDYIEKMGLDPVIYSLTEKGKNIKIED